MQRAHQVFGAGRWLPSCALAAASSAAIARWRARMGLSQRAAAAALGVAQTTLQDQGRGINRQTGQPIRMPHSLLACAALEAGLPTIN